MYKEVYKSGNRGCCRFRVMVYHYGVVSEICDVNKFDTSLHQLREFHVSVANYARIHQR